MKPIFGFTRYLIILGVVGSLLLSMVLFVAALIEAIAIAVHFAQGFSSAEVQANVSVSVIKLADDILIAAAMYITSAGLYELFIGKANLPEWLRISTLDDLKDRLIGVSVAVLVVNMVEQVATWDGQTNLLNYGLPLAAVIFAVAAYKFVTKIAHK